MEKCADCTEPHKMLYSTPTTDSKHSHSLAVCKECFKKRRGQYPDQIKKGEIYD